MKKLIAGAVAVLMCAAAFAGCAKNNGTPHTEHDLKYEYLDGDSHKISCSGCDYSVTDGHDLSYENLGESGHKVTCTICKETIDTNEEHSYSSPTDLECDDCGYVRDWHKLVSTGDSKENLSAGGYVKNKIIDFSQYAGTSAYRTVSTAGEFIEAIMAARWDYTSAWDGETESVKQTLNNEGSVHVIEIADDLDMAYNKLPEEYVSANGNGSYIENYSRNKDSNIKNFTMSDMFTENGITKIKIENTNNLLIYSKNGAKLTHCGFSLLSCDNVVIRNLEMDEIWQWEDTASTSISNVGDYDAFGWAYVKVAHCGYIWIDHCTFGKSYDGQIDYSNPVYNTKSTAFRAPYGATGANGLHISWCKFNAGSDDPNGYMYKMMENIEADYKSGGKNYLYYNALRNGGISFEDILYGLAIPQKKGFLCGDSGNGHSDYDMNLSLQISFANCYFKNLEDRLPKLRGGNAVMYNCIVDSSQYYTYRTKLKSANAESKVKTVKNNWKCALVSQGIVCGNGGSFYGENCIFKGIETLLKNNDSGGSPNLYAEDGKTVIGTTSRPANGGYKLLNCRYRLTETSTPITSGFPNSNQANLNTENFSWHTQDGNAPFAINAVPLDGLEDELNHVWYGAGVSAYLQEKLLKSNYGA
ncbi:MAG: hypothetical protein NC131_02410 [Roseburia sp.]|nr:hypothetical protein [Roseburia sp.]